LGALAFGWSLDVLSVKMIMSVPFWCPGREAHWDRALRSSFRRSYRAAMNILRSGPEEIRQDHTAHQLPAVKALEAIPHIRRLRIFAGCTLLRSAPAG
jgi:hypothetical protein